MRVSDGEVYAGTVADFTEVDPLIHRWDSLRTTQYDLKYLNGNHFFRPFPFVIISYHYYYTKAPETSLLYFRSQMTE